MNNELEWTKDHAVFGIEGAIRASGYDFGYRIEPLDDKIYPWKLTVYLLVKGLLTPLSEKSMYQEPLLALAQAHHDLICKIRDDAWEGGKAAGYRSYLETQPQSWQ